MSCPYETDCETSETQSVSEKILPTDSEPEEEILSEYQNESDELDDDKEEDLYACDTESCPSRGISHDGSAQCECGEAKKLAPPAKRLRKGKHERYAFNGDESE
jgi:hypothetical protein